MNQLGWELDSDPDTRCGITSIFVERALFNKENVLGLRRIYSHRTARPLFGDRDYDGDKAATLAIKSIAEKTGKSTENIRLTLSVLSDVARLMADHRSEKEIEESVDDARYNDIPDPDEEVIESSLAFYKGIVETNPELIEPISEFLDSGWGHQIVLVDIMFSGEEVPRRFLIDANSEQFGDDYDKLFLVPISEAVDEGYMLNDLGVEMTKDEMDLLGGNTDRMDEIGKSRQVKTTLVPKAEASKMIAAEYRRRKGIPVMSD